MQTKVKEPALRVLTIKQVNAFSIAQRIHLGLDPAKVYLVHNVEIEMGYTNERLAGLRKQAHDTDARRQWASGTGWKRMSRELIGLSKKITELEVYLMALEYHSNQFVTLSPEDIETIGKQLSQKTEPAADEISLFHPVPESIQPEDVFVLVPPKRMRIGKATLAHLVQPGEPGSLCGSRPAYNSSGWHDYPKGGEDCLRCYS